MSAHNSTSLLLDTSHDATACIYISESLRINAHYVTGGLAGGTMRVYTETRTTDRLGEEQWVRGGTVTRAMVEKLAQHVFTVRGLTRPAGMSWTRLTGSNHGYRVLSRPAPWYLRVLGRTTDVVVERDFGSNAAPLWKDADALWGSDAYARIAFLLKRELWRHEVQREQEEARLRASAARMVATQVAGAAAA